MSLLVHPVQADDEGPSGYRLRLASANLLSFRDVVGLENVGELDFLNAQQFYGYTSNDYSFNPLIKRWARFCPGCLAAKKIWDVGWELLFAEACPICGHWLVDLCSGCGGRIPWTRTHLFSCDCGHNLLLEKSCHAPDSVIQLSRALQSVAMRRDPKDCPVFRGLRLEQCARLIRLLGTYANADGRNVPQKVADVDRLSVSWPITSSAAEILSSWPAGFVTFLESLRRHGGGESNGRLPKAFGGFYSALYKGFKEDEFHFLRTAFENYVAEHWTGGIAKRNRRMSESVLEKMSWIPANHACRLLGVSRRRLKDLVREGKLRGETRHTAGQRQFIVVRRSDVEELALKLDDGMPLDATAIRLGLKKQRLLGLLPVICPDAKKLGVQGCPWSIPTDWVESWEKLIKSQKPIADADSTNVTLSHLLRYWPWTDEQIGDLLVAIHSGSFVTGGRHPTILGIGSLFLSVDHLHAWLSNGYSKSPYELTLPEAASRMGVKQEVIYSLTRSGFLKVSLRKSGRRSEQRVSFSALEEFEHQYVFCRDVALRLKRSPRAILKFFESENVRPVAGPGIDGCRQVLFDRRDVESSLGGFCARWQSLTIIPVEAAPCSAHECSMK